MFPDRRGAAGERHAPALRPRQCYGFLQFTTAIPTTEPTASRQRLRGSQERGAQSECPHLVCRVISMDNGVSNSCMARSIVSLIADTTAGTSLLSTLPTFETDLVKQSRLY
ncbi:MAG TPA: hypothetical protein VG759_08505 [Candidatus Angelobacter sp.]|nr:hypothetical protein [Candidatus Angelobacter sp.]